MDKLEPPAELLDLEDGASETFRILRWLQGELEIQPRETPAGKIVPALRMWVPPEDKPAGAPYWDATAGNLIARLLPMLDELVATGRKIRVTKQGKPPVARHRVDFL
ncbi:hypothetical protein LCGC14_0768130 [marine sediment metagenome]|uniref:Uncharacterized protein n=1 Tax=marine sediment metagenome TaxID=412755 RepID=A0A0F9QJ02_9ZZZZ